MVGMPKSKASSWLGAVELDKVAGLGCSLVPVFCLHFILCLKFCESRHRNSPNSQRNSKKLTSRPKSIQGYFLAKSSLGTE